MTVTNVILLYQIKTSSCFLSKGPADSSTDLDRGFSSSIKHDMRSIYCQTNLTNTLSGYNIFKR